jgi:hypothetical protein
MPVGTYFAYEKKLIRDLKSEKSKEMQTQKGLFKKSHEYSIECDPDVYVALLLRSTGQVFSFNPDSTDGFSPSLLLSGTW